MLLYEHPNRWIGHRDLIEWDLRSSDLSPRDFFCGVTSSRKSMEQGLGIFQRSKSACASVTSEMFSDIGQACVERWLDCCEKGGAPVQVYH